jgi:hypothetical protein
MIKIQCKKVVFYSPRDEESFFLFAKSIPAIRKIDGAGDSIFLHLRTAVSDSSLRDLLALLLRYKIGMKSLAKLKTKKNSGWFCDPAQYWHKKVF